MKFVPVTDIPKRKIKKPTESCDYKPIRLYLQEFMQTGNKYVRVVYDTLDYASALSAQNAFIKSVKNTGYPISVIVRQGDIYLMRKDI